MTRISGPMNLPFFSQPGQADIQSDLFYDYRTNVDAYPKWQAWMREKQPRLLVIWGKYELSFDPSEPEAYRRDVPKAEVHIVDGGHFALDTAADQIAQFVRELYEVEAGNAPAAYFGKKLEMENTQKTAIVTGASQGIGAGAVQAFLQRGYRVVANSRNMTKANPFPASADLALVDGDIGDPSTAATIVDTAVSRFGRIDALVNNAGIYFSKPFTDYTVDDLRSLVSVNIDGFVFHHPARDQADVGSAGRRQHRQYHGGAGGSPDRRSAPL